MAEGEQRQTLNLNLASMHSVKLVRSLPRVQDAAAWLEPRVESAKQYRVLAWILTAIQFQLVWTYTLIHSIPWPAWFIGGVHYMDEKVETALVAVVDKAEWVSKMWEDWVTIKGMRWLETAMDYFRGAVEFVDRIISGIMAKYEQRKEYAWVLDYATRAWQWTTSTISSVWLVIKDTIEKLDKVWRNKEIKTE